MKRKLLSVLLTLCLAFSLLPTAALADGETAVAKVGVTEYATLAEAVEKADSGATVTLLKDTAVSAMIMLKKSLTLNLNGHKLNNEGNINSWVQVIDNAKLTINGTVEGSAAYGRMNLGIATNNNGSLEINGGIYAVGDDQTVLHINGTCMSSDVTINGATINATNDNGIQLNGKGTFSITNSMITGGTGIYIKAGTLTLENTKVTGTLSPVNYSYNGNGANATGDAVVIDACNYPGGNPTIAIKSGEFTGSKAAIGYYQHSGSDSTAAPGTATISITGGTFNTDVSAYVADGYILNNGTVEKLGETNAVAKVGNTYYKTLAEAIAAAQNGKTVTLLKNIEGCSSLRPADGSVVTIDLNDHNIKFNQNQSFSVVGSTLNLIGKGTVEESKPYYSPVMMYGGENAENYSVLNVGENVTLKGWSAVFIDNTTGGKNSGIVANINGHLFGLKDTSGDTGPGVYVNGNIKEQTYAPKITMGATSTIEATGTGMYLAGYAETVVENGAQIAGDITGIEIRAGKLTVNGGVITGNGVPTSVTPNGNGTTSNGVGIAVAQHTTKQNLVVKILGGEINGYSALYESNPQSNSDDDIAKVTMDVADGKFKAINGGTAAVYSQNKTGFITGGLFSSDPSAYCAEGKTGVASGNSQYPYTVGTKVANAQPAHVDTATVPAKTAGDASQDVKDVANEITGANVTNNAAEAATKDLANENKLTGDDQITVNGTTKTITEAVKEVTSDSSLTKDNVAIVYQTYVDVTVTDAKKDATGVTEITVDLTPMYRVVATTSTVVGNDDEKIKVHGDKDVTNPNAVVIQEGKKLDLGDHEYEVKLALPNGFAAADAKLSIKHTKDNGTVEYYTGVVSADGKSVTFTTKGFSPFTISAPAASIDETMYPTLAEAIAKAANGNTIKLEKNCTESVTVSGKSLTINKNNHEYDFAKVTVDSNSTKTVSGEGKILTITYTAPSYSSGSSSYDPTYSVSTPSKTEHGTVTVSPKSASKGDRVTVTVKPDSGYVLETLTVTDKNGNELTLKDKGDGKYTFTMPAGKVEVKATFMEDNSMLNFFYDVPNNAYFYEAVKWAVKNGITTGVGNDLFAPEQPCTRAQIVTFLWRAAGSPEPKGAASGMTDVVSGSYYEKAVAWAIENGITTGTTTSTFSPDATCTRAQAVTFLARALKAKAASAAEFSDVPTGSYFADAVAWAAANGVTEGIGGGLFGSDNDCTRGQIVTFLYRAYNK